jgi:hypothetical protein
MRKILLILVMSIFLISLASAYTFGPYPLNSNVTLKQLGQDYVPDYCNITSITNPNSVELITTPISMAKNGNDFVSSFSNTPSLGLYAVCGECADSLGSYDGWCYYVKIGEDNTVFFLIFIISSVVLLILAFILENKIFSFISGLLFLGTGVYSMIYGFGSITNDYTHIISIVLIGLGAIISIVSSLDFMNEMAGGGNDDEE